MNKHENYNTTINGIDVKASYSERAIHGIFIPLLQHITELQKTQNKRILVMLAAPPGAGKSTLLSFLQDLSSKYDDIGKIQIIGMDGFHRRQEYLLSHYVERDGEEIPMVEIKGAPITFDLDSLKERIVAISSGDNCGWPTYDRLLHNPVENAQLVEGSIIFLEGNYLLLDEDGWRDLSKYADYTISVTADEYFLRKRLIDRRIKTGVDEERATQFVDYSDMSNVRLCLERMLPASLQLRLDSKGDYHVV